MQLEGLGQSKNPISSGIKHTTFQLVAVPQPTMRAAFSATGPYLFHEDNQAVTVNCDDYYTILETFS
jgi:hypothetical protein